MMERKNKFNIGDRVFVDKSVLCKNDCGFVNYLEGSEFIITSITDTAEYIIYEITHGNDIGYVVEEDIFILDNDYIEYLINKNYGGVVSDEEWSDFDLDKYCIGRCGGELIIIDSCDIYHFLAFHSENDARHFLKDYNDLCKKYLRLSK